MCSAIIFEGPWETDPAALTGLVCCRARKGVPCVVTVIKLGRLRVYSTAQNLVDAGNL